MRPAASAAGWSSSSDSGRARPHGSRAGRRECGRPSPCAAPLRPAEPPLHWTALAADGEIRDGELIEGAGGLRVVHTPGHSPGHIALVHEPSRTAPMGDAVFNRGGLALGPAALAADPGLRAGSLARLPEDLRAIGFAHGPALTGAGTADFARFVAGLTPSA